MRIELYEQIKENLTAQAAKRQEDNAVRAAVATEVATARKYLQEVLDQAVAGQDLAAEVGKAQGVLTIAEEKQRRLQEQLKSTEAGHNQVFTLHSVVTEIQAQIRDGRLMEEFQPLLNDLNEMRQQYMDKLKALMIRQRQVNKELYAIQMDAANIERSLMGESKGFGWDGPAAIKLSDFGNWIWVGTYALPNQMHELEFMVESEVNE